MSTVVNEDTHRASLDSNRPSLDGEHDPHYDPIISLPEVKIPTLEEEETVLHHVRAKLYRHDKIDKEWKERGTGEAKLLYHENNNTVRILMRRDKTLKLCANHYVTLDMVMNPKSGSDRACVWTTHADVADGSPKSEILAMRFMNSEAAKKWKEKFEEAKQLIKEGFKLCGDVNDDKDEGVSSSQASSDNEEEQEVLQKVEGLTLTEESDVVVNKEESTVADKRNNQDKEEGEK